MYCSDKSLDFFQEESIDEFFEQSTQQREKCLSWTGDFLASLEITPDQRRKLVKLAPSFIEKKYEVKSIISSLK